MGILVAAWRGPRAPHPPTVAALLRQAACRSANARLDALLALRDGPYDRFAVRLAARALLTDSSELNRSEAAETLGGQGNRADTWRLLAALRDESWTVRSSAALALGEIGDPRAIGPIIRVLNDDEHEVVRRDAADALACLRTDRALAALEQHVTAEPSGLARTGILIALYRLGQRDRLTEVLRLLDDPDFLVRSNVVNGLRGWVAPEDAAVVSAAVRAYMCGEPNPGRVGDARALLAELDAVTPPPPPPDAR